MKPTASAAIYLCVLVIYGTAQTQCMTTPDSTTITSNPSLAPSTAPSTVPSTAPSTAPSNAPPATTTIPVATPYPSTAPDNHDDDEHPTPREYRPFDGWFNNFANPAWGGAETQLLRKVAPVYEDGSYEPSGGRRPNPMDLSMNTFNGTTGRGSYRNRTAFLVFFGQQVVEEVLDAQRGGCPVEYKNIKIPEGHVHFDRAVPENEMPFIRSRYDQSTGYSPNNPRQQLNEISSWIDGTLVYGPNKAWLDAIRAFEGGLMAEDDVRGPYNGSFPAKNTIRLPFANPPPPRDHTLKPINRFNRIGNPRGNENPFLLSMGVMWFRYHNYWARKLAAEHPSWNDEQLFLEARKMVIGIYQKIVAYDWIPSWLGNDERPGDLDPYPGYNPSIQPGIAHVFQSAAMRFGHTLVTPGGYRRGKDCMFRNTTGRTAEDNTLATRTCNSFWNPQEALYEHDLDEMLLGLSSQIAEREDNTITPDLRGDVFGPLEFSRRDLMAINIQRARDHGVPDFNTVRAAYNLPRVNDFSDLIKNDDLTNPAVGGDPGLVDRVRALYNNSMDDVDLWVAGILETNKGPGETFQAIIREQFARIRDGDRFWYENRQNGLYSDDEISIIENTRVIDVILATTTIKRNEIQDDPFFINETDQFWMDNPDCMQPAQLKIGEPGHLAECSDRKGFDYFWGSEWSYALSFAAVFLTFFIFLGILFWLAKVHREKIEQERSKQRKASRRNIDTSAIFLASEWQGRKDKWRNIKLKLEARKKHVMVQDEAGRPLRTVDLKFMADHGNALDSYLSADKNMTMIIIKLPREYDLVLKFDNSKERDTFLNAFKHFLGGEPGMSSPKAVSEKQMFTIATTKEDRKKQLENFFKAVFAHVAKDEDDWEGLGMNADEVREVLRSELTKYEFAEALGLRATDSFVENMFNMIDQDNSGTVSFREFVDLIVIFYNGNSDDKMRLLFNMYDVGKTGTLSTEDFKNMLKSLVELSNTSIEDDKIHDLIKNLCERAGIDSKRDLTFNDFQVLLKDYESELNHASLDFNLDGVTVPKNIRRENAPIRARKTLRRTFSRDTDPDDNKKKRFSTFPGAEIKTINKTFPNTPGAQRWNKIKRNIENYKLHIFWCSLYTLVSAGIFIERAYYYSVEREHAGLRRIAGDGVTITRGAASGMMFTFACLLVTMCRNIITWLRETFVHRYVPFDAAVEFHKYISMLALFFTLMHIIGHCINFYHISTQTADDLSCYFRNFFHATDELPKFHYWCFNTLTGFTGVLLAIQIFLIYIFATKYARRHSFRSFWITHNSYVIFFLLMILHGAGRLVQPGFFHYFLLGPAILFTIDRLISISRKKVEISVMKAELLPSDVTFLEFKRPSNFEYKSGQWVRIACMVQGKDEYHPFTLSSAPHEENLTLHIRAIGPWTLNLRRTYNPENVKEHAWPKIFLDGPYGEGHQDWYKFEVAVLVGGGIGVTPFASILKDIAHKSKTGAKIRCKKVYFLWVTRTQKHFEWMTDIIREVEASDKQNLVDVHIFITQFKQKFDIRTTMLYICERYFQKFSQRSLFTGLESITHFGRPDFESFLQMLSAEHSDTSVFGVFSCGPNPMTHNVERACQTINNKTANVLFVHHFENF